MKRIASCLLAVTLLLAGQSLYAQVHTGLGVTVGLDGVGPEIDLSINPNIDIRGGFAWMPGFKYSKAFSIDNDSPRIQGNVTAVGQLHLSSGKLLFDYYPSADGGFHITAGIYGSSPDVLLFYNQDPLPTDRSNWGTTSISVGSLKAGIDSEGYMRASARVNAIRPYLGVGFGRNVSPDKAVGFSFDLGAMYWGTPQLSAVDHKGARSYEKFSSSLVDNRDNGILDTISKFSIFPMLKFNLFIRLF